MCRISESELAWFGSWERRTASWYFSMSSLFLRDISHIRDGVSRGDKEFLIKDDESISFSIAIAFSHLRIYGCIVTWETITSEEIKYFYKRIFDSKTKLFNEVENAPILVWDNATINKSADVKKFIRGSDARILTIPPYSPWLNPTEHLIGWIKARIQTEISRGK